MVTNLENPQILIVEKKIAAIDEIVTILKIVEENDKPFLIIAEDIIKEALVILITKKARRTIEVAALKACSFDEQRKVMLEDIAVLTGGTVISEDQGIALENATIDMLGKAEKVYIDKDNTTIVNGRGDKVNIDKRVNKIKAQMETSTSDYDKKELQVRLNKLASGAAVAKWELFPRLK